MSRKKAAPRAKVTGASAGPWKSLAKSLSALGLKPGYLSDVILPSWWTGSVAEDRNGFLETVALVHTTTNAIARKIEADGFVPTPFLDYIRGLRSDNPRDVVTVYIPEYVVGHWWEGLLHNQTALLIRIRLQFIPGVMVTSVPDRLQSSSNAAERLGRDHPSSWRMPGVTTRSINDDRRGE